MWCVFMQDRNFETAQLTLLKSSAEATLRFMTKSHLSGEESCDTLCTMQGELKREQLTCNFVD